MTLFIILVLYILLVCLVGGFVGFSDQTNHSLTLR